MLSLLRSMYGAHDIADPRSRLETLIARMQRYAMENLRDPELGPEPIAQAHYVSTLYMLKISASSGTAVSSWIRKLLSEDAWADCADPRKRQSQPWRRGGAIDIR